MRHDLVEGRIRRIDHDRVVGAAQRRRDTPGVEPVAAADGRQRAPYDTVTSVVRAVFRGEAVCPPQLCCTLFRFVAQGAREISLQNSASKPDLTLRQQQLVTLVAKGLTNKEIASQLNLSEFTVRNHIHRILKQVDAVSRSEAVETIRAYGYSISS